MKKIQEKTLPLSYFELKIKLSMWPAKKNKVISREFGWSQSSCIADFVIDWIEKLRKVWNLLKCLTLHRSLPFIGMPFHKREVSTISRIKETSWKWVPLASKIPRYFSSCIQWKKRKNSSFFRRSKGWNLLASSSIDQLNKFFLKSLFLKCEKHFKIC